MFHALGMKITLEIDRKFCVFMHACGDEIIYIGSGPFSRAFHVGLRERGKIWFDAVAGRPVTVHILSTHLNRDEAFQAEFDHIYGLQPVANRAGISRPLTAKGMRRGRPASRGPKIGAWVYCETIDRKFATMREAAAVTGIPIASLSRALHSGRPTRHFGQLWRFKLV